jgi:hypothetical protein
MDSKKLPSKKFELKTHTKAEIARMYDVSTIRLRRWLMRNTDLWEKLNYDEPTFYLPPAKVKMIVDFLGVPGEYE